MLFLVIEVQNIFFYTRKILSQWRDTNAQIQGEFLLFDLKFIFYILLHIVYGIYFKIFR